MRGIIVKRGKSWAVVIDLPRDPQTKKRRQKWYTHTTQAEADRHLTQIKTALHGGTYQPPTALTVADFLAQWMRDAVRVGPLTLRDYRATVEKHLLPAFGSDPLLMLSAARIDGYLSDKQRAGLSAASVHKHLRVLHTALAKAVKWGLLVRNPAAMATPPSVPPRELVPWDEEAIRLFLGTARRHSRHYALFLTALLTGARMGELLGATWENVDLPTSRWTITHTFYRLGKQQLFKPPKSLAGRRTVALPLAVVEALRELASRQAEAKRILGPDYHDQGLVFCQADGKPLHAHNISQRDFKRVIAMAGVRPLRFHDLRHLHISYLAGAGVSVKVAQERVGHANPAVTLRIYTHTLSKQHDDAAQAVQDRLLGGMLAPVSRNGAEGEGGGRETP